MSRALDISNAGILLETAYPIESGCLSMMTVDVDSNLIEIKGELIYCYQAHNQYYINPLTNLENQVKLI
jgi:hypothetical protein